MKNSYKNKQPLKESYDFFKTLEERYNSVKSNNDYRLNQSKCRDTMKFSKSTKTKPELAKKQSQKQIKCILDVSKSIHAGCILQNKSQYNFDDVTGSTFQFSGLVRKIIEEESLKFFSIKVTQLGQNQKSSKTETFSIYVQELIKIFEKAVVCIYAMGKESKGEFYDMLSIRRQIKTNSKLLVQTNICNNSKSGVILKKLLEVAKERQKTINLEGELKGVIMKIKGVLSEDKENSFGHPRQIELQISSGDYGEVGTRSLMGAEKFRYFCQVYQINEDIEMDQITSTLQPFIKKGKALNESQLIQKIKVLQKQLADKKQQLQNEKQKVALRQAMTIQLQQSSLPSERPVINTQKFSSKICVAARRSYCRKQQKI